tara:strand:+ start:644 stop:1480 length:837 start_codon:yes stop_codon:yes gene_type:complete
MNNSATGYIYLIIEREFIKTDENIYKIGKTKQEKFKRFSQYPKGSCLLYYQKVNDYEKVEKEIIEKLKDKYKIQTDIGREYFKGSLIDIILDIIKITRNYVDAEGKMVDESKKYLTEYYNKLEESLLPQKELMDNFKKVLNGQMKEEEYEELLGSGNRHYLHSHKALYDIILKSLLEEYLICEYIVNTNQLKGREDSERCLILSRYNSYKYIIECIKGDPARGDISVSESSRKNMKIAGEFLNKCGGNQLMSSFLHYNIPKIFHREIEYIWDGIGVDC